MIALGLLALRVVELWTTGSIRHETAGKTLKKTGSPVAIVNGRQRRVKRQVRIRHPLQAQGRLPENHSVTEHELPIAANLEESCYHNCATL